MSLKYLNIYEEIKHEIETGKYKANDKLPDGNTIGKAFGASRMTVNKALNLLVQEGYIRRNRGQGTFVLGQIEGKRKLIIPENKLTGLTKISNLSHVKVSSRILTFKPEFASEKIADYLGIRAQDLVYNILRLRMIDDKPYVLERTYMSTNLIPGITKEVLMGSVYNYIEQELKLKIASANKKLRASISNDEDQKYLHLKPTEPVFEVEEIAYLDDGRPFEYSISRHRYDLFEFSSYALR